MMPRIRFTVRWLMVAVVIAALIFGGQSMMKRRAVSLRRAEDEAMIEQVYRGASPLSELQTSEEESQADSLRRSAKAHRQRAASKRDNIELAETHADADEGRARNAQEAADFFRILAIHERATADYHGNLRRKYERAARYPWLPVAPDPPEPKDPEPN